MDVQSKKYEVLDSICTLMYHRTLDSFSQVSTF